MRTNNVTPSSRFLTSLKVKPCTTSRELLEALDTKNVRVSAMARSTLKSVVIPDAVQIFQLYLVSPRDLGYERVVSYKEIIKSAEFMEYKPCPKIVGPYLALLYPSFLHHYNHRQHPIR
jgi:hypothetical protein